jgi:hypothetical protein
MAGLGRKTFSPGDVLTSSDVQGYLMDQAVMVFAGTAARASAIPSPSAGMVAYSTATQLQVYNGTAWVDASTGYGSASGTAASSTAITVSSVNYTLLTFTADSNLVVGKAGLFDVLLVAGGGGAGFESGSFCGGGGGAGGLLQTTIYAAAGTYAVTVGAGGAGQVEGLGSQIGSLVSCAGGGANRQTSAANEPATPGGSGAGAGVGTSTTGAVAIAGSAQGNAGGNKGLSTSAGGGGGKGAAGAAGSGTTGGAGGAGFDVSAFISGAALFKAGGGGGAGSVTGGAGGSSVGGAGSAGSNPGGNAAANTGGGGGGGGTSGGTGGSGIVYVRFKV